MKTAIVGMLSPEAMGAHNSRWLIVIGDVIHLVEGTIKAALIIEGLKKDEYQISHLTNDETKFWLRCWANL